MCWTFVKWSTYESTNWFPWPQERGLTSRTGLAQENTLYILEPNEML